MRSVFHAGLAALSIVGTAIVAEAAIPRTLMANQGPSFEFASAIPEQFGDWKVVPSLRVVAPVDSDSLQALIYSQLVGRGYRNGAGEIVMLLVAYGPRQNDRLQLHRPEICYVADGFRVSGQRPAEIRLAPGGDPVPVVKLLAQREGRVERITYWMRIGDDIVSNLMGRQYAKIRYGLQGLIADGVLVRVSTVNMDEATAGSVQESFLRDLAGSLSTADLAHFVGNRRVRAGEAPARAVSSN